MKLFLTKRQKKELLQEHRLEHNKRFADRIKAILLLDKGWTTQQVAEVLLIDESTVRRYKKSYEEGGLEGLIEDDYVGRSTKLTSEQEHELFEHLKENIYLNVKEIIHYVELTYKKPKVVPGKADVEQQMAFMIFLHKIKNELGPYDKIYFADATHPQHNSMPSYGWILKGQQKELKTNAGRQRLNLHGAIEIESLDCIVNEDETINYESTINLLKAIEGNNVSAKKIYVIVDNARYYHSMEVQEYLTTSKVDLIYLPSYSPNLNLIERLWKFFHKKILYNQYYEHFYEFREKTLNFFDDLKQYKKELTSLLSEKVEFVAV